MANGILRIAPNSIVDTRHFFPSRYGSNASTIVEREFFNEPPTLALSFPDNGGNSNGLAPTLQFIGSDINGDSLHYNIQIHTDNTFVSSTTLDSYGTSNHSNWFDLGNNYTSLAQAFTPNATLPVTSCQFYLRRTGSPTGTLVAKIFATTGTYGINMRPTGAALATSNSIDVTTIATGSFNLVTFTFPTGSQYTVTSGTRYCIAMEFSGSGTFVDYIDASTDSSPSHGGNMAYYQGATWAGYSDDMIFFVTSQSGALYDKYSNLDTGFANSGDGGDTAPFTQGATINYTLPSNLTLGNTYYWRVRTNDGFGYEDWSATRSFVVTNYVPPANNTSRGMFIGTA